MVVIATSTALSLTTGTKSAEQVAGLYQFIPKGTITLVAKQSASAATGLRVTMSVGGVPIINDQLVPFAGATGSLSINDNVVASQMVGGGLVSLTFRNDSAGTLTVDYQLLFTPGK